MLRTRLSISPLRFALFLSLTAGTRIVGAQAAAPANVGPGTTPAKPGEAEAPSGAPLGDATAAPTPSSPPSQLGAAEPQVPVAQPAPAAASNASSAASQPGLAESDKPLAPVVVTAPPLDEALPAQLSSYGTRVDRVSAEQIQNGGYTDVAQSLETLVPGLYVSPKNGPFDYVTVSLQGSRTQDVLWLLDGVRLNNRLYGGTTPLDTLPASIVERLEVLEGPQALFYGTQGVAGAVNIVTKPFSDQLTNQSLFENVSGTVRVRGGTVVLEARPLDALSANVSYTYTSARQTGDRQIDGVPTQLGKAWLDYHPLELPFGLSATANHVGTLHKTFGADDREKFGNYTIFDLAGRVFLDPPRQHTIDLRLANVFDIQYATGLAKGTSDADGSSYTYWNLGLPRTLEARYRYTF